MLTFKNGKFATTYPVLAKVFTVTKNEYDLIEDFINYYGKIFGYENVVIIDNGSDNPTVLGVYERYLPKGITIRYTTGYDGNKQAEHFTNVMREYKNTAEFLIGLDTDCFFGVHGSSNPDTIRSYLHNLPKNKDIFFMQKFYMSVVDVNSPNYLDHKLIRPTDCTTFDVRDNYCGTSNPHVFFRSANFVSTENGNHNGATTTQSSHFCEDVFYVHYHDTGRGRLAERCRSIMIGYGYIREGMTHDEELVQMRNLWSGAGIHRQRQYIHYLENPEEFMEEPPIPSNVVEFSGVKSLLLQ